MTDLSDPLLQHTATIVAAHMNTTPTDSTSLPGLISQVYSTLAGLSGIKPTMSAPAPALAPKPVVPPEQSVFDDYIICLEDGMRLKMLSGHVRRVYGMSMDQYRAKWGLPANYPATAPAYSVQRSEMAKRIGLGKRRTAPVEAPPSAVQKAAGKKTAGKKAQAAVH